MYARTRFLGQNRFLAEIDEFSQIKHWVYKHPWPGGAKVSILTKKQLLRKKNHETSILCKSCLNLTFWCKSATFRVRSRPESILVEGYRTSGILQGALLAQKLISTQKQLFAPKDALGAKIPEIAKMQKCTKSVDFTIMHHKSINLAFVLLGFGANSRTGLLLQGFQETVEFVNIFS